MDTECPSRLFKNPALVKIIDFAVDKGDYTRSIYLDYKIHCAKIEKLVINSLTICNIV
jgi:hypothetical protein